jgi:hypothetical protein
VGEAEGRGNTQITDRWTSEASYKHPIGFDQFLHDLICQKVPCFFPAAHVDLFCVNLNTIPYLANFNRTLAGSSVYFFFWHSYQKLHIYGKFNKRTALIAKIIANLCSTVLKIVFRCLPTSSCLLL